MQGVWKGASSSALASMRSMAGPLKSPCVAKANTRLAPVDAMWWVTEDERSPAMKEGHRNSSAHSLPRKAFLPYIAPRQKLQEHSTHTKREKKGK